MEGKKRGATAAKIRYNEKAYDRLYISVPKGMKDEIATSAEAGGESIRAFVIRAITDAINKAQK